MSKQAPANPELDRPSDTALFRRVPARKLTALQHKELREMLAEIDRLRQERAETDPKWRSLEFLARKAGHGISTWHAWRRDEDPTSPKFFDLRDFARVVGCDLRWIPQTYTSGVGVSHAGTGEANVTDETKQLVAIMEKLPQEARQNLVTTAIQYEKVWGGAGNPSEPDAEESQTRGRRNAPGPTAK